MKVYIVIWTVYYESAYKICGSFVDKKKALQHAEKLAEEEAKKEELEVETFHNSYSVGDENWSVEDCGELNTEYVIPKKEIPKMQKQIDELVAGGIL